MEGILRQSADVDDVEQRVKEYEEGVRTHQIVFEECHRMVSLVSHSSLSWYKGTELDRDALI